MNKRFKKIFPAIIVIVFIIVALLLMIYNAVNNSRTPKDVDNPNPSIASDANGKQNQPSTSGNNQNSTPTNSEVVEIDYSTLGKDYTETELSVKVSSKTAVYMKNQLFYAIKVAVMDEDLMYFVSESQFNNIRTGDKYIAMIRTYKNSKGTVIKSIISLRTE